MSPQSFQAPRGTTDVLPGEQTYWRLFHSKAEEAAATFGYERIDTPTIEDADLFLRGVGEITDIVEKETYTFEDRGGDRITLRPEGTAPVCRAYLQHGMQNLPQPVRLFYFCPMFRYDRPQAGRLREHHQFGIEALGEGDPSMDAEVVELAWTLLGNLGLDGLTLLVNSVGDSQCRPSYVERLKEYYETHIVRTCPNCPRRLRENPLRLLDCKERSCQPVIAGAPGSVEYLCGDCASHWNELKANLDSLGIPFEVDNKLVRGLDYYTRTAFEIVPPGARSQGTIVGGGRYDGLMEELGGRPTSGIGFGMGIERVLMELRERRNGPQEDSVAKVLLAHTGDAAKEAAMALGHRLRGSGVATVLAPPGRSLKSQLRYASAISATHAVIIGDRELDKGTVIVRDLGRSEQTEVPANKTLQHLRTLFP